MGAGNACRLWLPMVARMQTVELRGIVDVDVERARALLGEFGVDVPVRPALAPALEELSPHLVVDLTPPATRAEVAAAAFAAGCDLICEKPLATSVAAAGELLRLSDGHGRRFAVMQNHRFHPGARAVRRAIAAGRLGEPFLVACDLHRAVEPFARVADLESPLLSDMAIHAFDQARHLTGLDAIRVLAAELAPPGGAFSGATVAVCTFELEGGALFSYRGSWAAAGEETPWPGRWRVDGSEAAATWPGDGAPRLERLLEQTPTGPRFAEEPLEVEPGPNDHPAAVPALLEAMAAGAPLETEARDNVRSLAMVEAAIASSRAGGWVDVPRPAAP